MKLKDLIDDIKFGIEHGTDREGIRIDGIGLSWENLKLLLNEIERLNNIIKELEKIFEKEDYQYLQRKLKELKGENK